jgi:hypothetical protein
MEQTPQEFARELVNEFSRVGLQQRNEGVQCAKIAIKKIIKIQEYWGGVDCFHYKFYTEALKEVDNL